MALRAFSTVTPVTSVTRVTRRFKLAAAATVAVAAIGGGVIGTMPVLGNHDVVPVATTLDASSMYNDAQKKFAAGDVAGGLAALKQVVSMAPADAEAIALQAIWSDQLGDSSGVQGALSKLSMMNPQLATIARNIISGVEAAAKIVPDTTPKTVAGRPTIVILGYGLNGNGKMAPELVNRVRAGKAQAEVSTTAPIVVTGGAPKSGVTEASAMQKWLVDNGVDASRITTEDKSGSTVANAQNTAAILQRTGVRDIILITSPNHIRRAAADFAATGLRVVGTLTTSTELSRYAATLPKERQTGIRVEATRTAKIPVSRQPGALPQNLPDAGPGLIPEIGGKLLELLGTGSSK